MLVVALRTTWPRMSRPTRSVRRNVAIFGQPTAVPVSASTSSTLRSISCIRRMTLSAEKVPMRLAMKFGVSLAWTTPLPRWRSQKLAMVSIAAGSASGVGNQLQQAHVARRIEEVRAEPEAAEVIGKAFDDLGHRQPAGVGGDDRAGLANRFDLAQQAALDLEVFDDGLDDPIDVGEFLQIVFEVSDGHQAGERRLEESGRLGFHRGFQTGGGDASCARARRHREERCRVDRKEHRHWPGARRCERPWCPRPERRLSQSVLA